MKRAEVKEAYKWKLEDIYADDSAWEEELKEAEKEIDGLDFRETFTESAQSLADAYERIDSLSLKCERLYVYARMRRDEDNANTKYQAMTDRAMGVNIKASAALSFFDPALIAVGADTLLRWIEEEKRLAPYAFGIKELLRAQEHVLDEKCEMILSKAADFAEGPSTIFTMLNNSDLKFGEVDGKPLTHGSYILFLQDKDETIRKEAYEKLYGAYRGMINTISSTYAASVKKDCFYADVRGYGSALEGALFSDNVPKTLYTNLIDTVRKNLDVMHDYVALKKSIIGKDSMRMYDIFVPLAEKTDRTYSYEEACDMVLEACAPLGADYVSLLKRAMTERWIDVEETEGKTSGAYSWGTYGTHPYVLLNHRGDLDSVFTIAHELGHALHTYYSNETQPYSLSSYRIFVAEVASTVNEILMTRYLLGHTEGEQKKYVLNHYLDQFRTTVVRQTMFAEFEMLAHEMAERGEALTSDSLSEIYGRLNSEYHGKSMDCDDLISLEWMRIPHFYTAFYVYKYATGFSCAEAIVKDILNSGDAGRYRDFLRLGGSMLPLDELKKAGVDLESGKPVSDCMEAFRSALEDFKKLN